MIEDKAAEEAAIESLRTGKRAPIARLIRESARRLVHQAQDLEHFGGSAAHLAACAKLREAARSLYREADAQERADEDHGRSRRDRSLRHRSFERASRADKASQPPPPAPVPAHVMTSPARVTLDFVGDVPSSEPFRVYIVDKATVTASVALAGSPRSIGMGRNVRKSLTRPGVYVVDVTIDGAV